MNYKFIAPDWFSQNISHFNNFTSNLKGKNELVYLEVGVWEGRSFVWVLENILTGNMCQAYAIDPWLPYQELNEKELQLHSQAENIFDKNIETCLSLKNHHTQIIKMKMNSAEAIRKIESKTVDLAYIDGSHSAPDVLEDMVGVWRLLKPGGVVICDDVYYGKFKDSNKDPRYAASAFLACHKDDAIVLAHNHALVMRKKI